MSKYVIEGGEEALTELLSGDLPVIVDFWAPWCMPCRMLTSALEVIAKECEGEIRVINIDLDQNKGLASNHDVRTIPTIIAFRNGEEIDRTVGFEGRIVLEQFFHSVIEQDTTMVLQE